MGRRRKQSQSAALLGLLVLLVILVIGGYFIYQNLQKAPEEAPPAAVQTPPDDAEKQAGDAARAEPSLPAGISVEAGSGGSISGEWYQLYFTNPIYPDNRKNHKGGLDEQLVNLMNKATKTLDVADYDFDLMNVAEAMAKAKQRGVQVRMVTDTDTLNDKKNKEVQAALDVVKKANIPIVGDERGPIMHNKFTVVDKQWIETGSWNYTDGDTYHLNNNMIIINSPQLAQNYTTEFEKMFVKKEFGPNKDKGVPNPVVTIQGTKIENYFAAEDGVAQHLIDTINSAKQSVYFLAFSFTHDGIGQAIEAKAKAGLKVGGVFETTGSNTPFSEYTKMKKVGLDVYTDGNPWVMHHKVIIVDEQTVVMGSFNFSDNADKSNDENVLIIHNADIAKAYKAEYDKVLSLAKNPPAKKK